MAGEMVEIQLGGTYIRKARERAIKEPTKKDADFQLDCIQKYLRKVGEVQAEYLKKKGKLKKEDTKFSIAEAWALYHEPIKRKKETFLLKINWTAQYRMSWILERIYHLVSPSKAKQFPPAPLLKQPKKIMLLTGYELIKITRENYNEVAFARGTTRTTTEGDLLISVAIDDFLNERYPGRDDLEQYRQGNRPVENIPKLEPEQIGKYILHELVIHGWRHIYFSDIQNLNPDMNSVEAFLYSKHLDCFHKGSRTIERHSWADIEADMIELYCPEPGVWIGTTDILTRCPRRKKSLEIASTEMGWELYFEKWEKKYKELIKNKNN